MKSASSKLKRILAFVFTIILTLMVLPAGLVKLIGDVRVVDEFARWGYPEIVMYGVGVLEVMGVVGLWIKSTRKRAAGLIAIIMIGALVTNILNDPWAVALVPGVLFLLASELVWIRKSSSRYVDHTPEPAKEEPVEEEKEEEPPQEKPQSDGKWHEEG